MCGTSPHSQEYSAINDVERHRPEIVFSALIKLCIRLHKKEMAGRLLWGERATLRQIHKLFEKIARSHASSTKYTLVTIMFDRLAQGRRLGCAAAAEEAVRTGHQRAVQPVDHVAG